MLGATCAVGIYHLFFEKPVELAISGFLFAIPNFWLICAMPKYVYFWLTKTSIDGV